MSHPSLCTENRTLMQKEQAGHDYFSSSFNQEDWNSWHITDLTCYSFPQATYFQLKITHILTCQHTAAARRPSSRRGCLWNEVPLQTHQFTFCEHDHKCKGGRKKEREWGANSKNRSIIFQVFTRCSSKVMQAKYCNFCGVTQAIAKEHGLRARRTLTQAWRW